MTQATNLIKRLLLPVLALGLAVGCTQQQTQLATFEGNLNPSLAPMMLQHQCSITYEGKVTTLLQMQVSGNSLFLSGYPFGLSEWSSGDICDNPVKIFAASEQVDTFSPANSYLESWNVDNEASAALAVTPGAQFIFSSGRLGSSSISIGNPSLPQVGEQFPRPDPSSGSPQRDPNFEYTAIAINPTKNMMYGFRQTDYEFTMTASMPEVTLMDPIFDPTSGSQVSSATAPLTNAYTNWMNGGDTCCVTNAAVFGTKVFVSYGSSLLGLDMDPSSGYLENPKVYTSIQATNVVSTPNHLYVQHQASYEYSAGVNVASGIYVFDTSGNNVAYLNVSPQRFAVSADDSQLFTYQNDATNTGAMQIYRILWTN